jgi:hypothetical protein
MGTRTDLEMHHWNWRGNPGPLALVMAYGGSTNGAEWVEVSGHRMSKHGSGDKGRDVWTMGTLKGTGAVHGRIMLRGKIYTFTIPRGHIIYDINLHGGGESSSKPTKKPTRPTSGSTGSDDQYGHEHGGDRDGQESTTISPDGTWGGPGGSTSDGTKGSDAATDIGDLPDASADDSSSTSGDDGGTQPGGAPSGGHHG